MTKQNAKVHTENSIRKRIESIIQIQITVSWHIERDFNTYSHV